MSHLTLFIFIPLAEGAIITHPPLDKEKSAEGQTATLQCTVFGSPKPLVVWRKGDEQLTGGRFRVLENGHLEITVNILYYLFQIMCCGLVLVGLNP